MCGIAGLMRADGAAPDPARLAAMLRAVAHRGPDGEGSHSSGSVALGQARLAIIDLAGGRQPLFGADGIALVANGEIYNYRELYGLLPDVQFATGSDCEPPLHLYHREGADFLRHLRGMYALALHDPRDDSLILARDPFGIKPLYYAEAQGHLIFASEPAAIFASGLLAPRLVAQKRDELLQLQFTCGADTIFAGVRRLLPGEMLLCRRGRIVESRRRAALQIEPSPGDEAAALARLDALLQESVDLHQRSDVPYGLFLSGGIDSSALLAMMARLNPRPVLAYSLGFPDSGLHDERELAAIVARKLGAEHRRVDFTATDFWLLLPQVAQAMDDPAADYACLPTFKLAQFAAREVKVVLSGEGGDEIFGGYGRYRAASRWLFGRPMRRKGALDGLGLFRQPPAAWRQDYAHAEAAGRLPGESRLQAAQRLDMADWLPNDLLTKLDRCLMRNALEGRTPFLDCGDAAGAGLGGGGLGGFGLGGFGFGLPDGLKIRAGLGKHLLRAWLARAVPEAQPFSRKRGFTVPVGQWIAAEGARLAPLLARQPGIVEAFQPEAVTALIRDGAGKHGFAAWALLFYGLWHQHHILGLPAEGDAFAMLSAA